jgi:adenylate kinase
MNQIVIMFVGVSGVGKTTFLNNLRPLLSFQHLTAGTLIAAGTRASDRDRLRLSNIDNNQQRLIDGFSLQRDQSAEIVVLDGHAIIDTGSGLDEIRADVFAELKIKAMVHLTAAPERILHNRTIDLNRARPLLSMNELSQHQARSVAHSEAVARTLTIPFVEVAATEHEKMLSLVAELNSTT